MSIIFISFLSAVIFETGAATSSNQERIVGGEWTTIEKYPYFAALLFSFDTINLYQSACGGTILNRRSVLSAAHCFDNERTQTWRIRVGSTRANSGGTFHNGERFIMHPDYGHSGLENDIAIARASTDFVYSNTVQPAVIASANYYLPDNSSVWAIGWGATYYGGPGSERFRDVEIWTVNQNTCRERYAAIGPIITDSMICAGWLDVGGRDQCTANSGGPLIHKNIIVGVCSWGYECAHPVNPGVNTRVSSFSSWIISNAT